MWIFIVRIGTVDPPAAGAGRGTLRTIGMCGECHRAQLGAAAAAAVALAKRKGAGPGAQAGPGTRVGLLAEPSLGEALGSAESRGAWPGGAGGHCQCRHWPAGNQRQPPVRVSLSEGRGRSPESALPKADGAAGKRGYY